MADKKTGTETDNQAQNQDPNFVYGDAPAKKKIDAWEGEGEVDLVNESGEMALANLHFGTTPEADLLKSEPLQEETSGDADAAGKSSDIPRVTVEVEENLEGAVIASLGTTAATDGVETSYDVSDDRFEIIDGQLVLRDGISLDFETDASLDVTVTATDANGVTTSETFIVDLIDVNDAPTDLELDGNTVAENAPGAVIGTLSSFDADADDSVTYTVSDDRFEVVDGQLQLVDGVSLDHEEAASIELTVTATDSGGLSTEETFTIDVLDVNEGPSDLALDGNSVAENDAGVVVGTLSSFDPDAGDTVTYTLSDDRFEVVDGEVRLVDGVSLNHEEAASIELTVIATDSGGLSTEETFTIDVTDVNEGPSDLSLDGSSVAENDAGAVVGTLSSFDPDAGDSVTYTVSDERFEVVDGEVRVVDGVSLNHEEAASIELTVTATDSGGLSTEETFTIDVTDVNEGPSDLSLDGNTVAENDAGATVGTLSSFDPDAGDTITYTVSDDRFEVVEGEVRLVDGVSLNHEEAASIELTVTATDSGGLSTEETFTIDVTDVNEGPSDLSLDGSTIAENDAGAVVGTLSSFDPDAGDTVTYTVSDDRFEVVDGEVRLVDGVSLNHEEAASIELTVTATDSGGLSTEETFTIDVTDVNEGPSDLSLDGNSVAENDAGATVGTLSSFDPDAGDSVTYTVSDDRFEVVDGEVRLVDGVSLNHEEAASIELTVTATDSGGLSTEETFTIDVVDVNEGPSDLALDGGSVAENDAGAVIGTLSSFDPDAGDTVSYTVSDDRFEVVDGEVRLVEGVSLDHEDSASIELTITATDSGGLSTEETFTIDVADVNEGPSDLALDGGSVAENDAGAVVGSLSSFDPDAGDTVTYTVSDDRFEVVDGEVRLVDGVSLNHEEAASIELTVTATDSGGLSTEETFTIDVTDVNEGPSDLSLDGSSVAENDAGAVVGTLSSFDPDAGDSVSYTVSDDRFEVVDGEVRLVDGVSLNHEEAASIELTVTATDSGGLSTEETFTIDVVDVNEGPSDLSLDGNTVAENDAGAVVGTLSSFDPDAGDSVTYTVSDDRFEVVDGEVRLVDGVILNHEEAASLELTVTATDSGGLSTEETFTIDVTDVNEGPSDLSLDGNSVAENDAGATVGTLSSFDPDAGDTVTYTVSDDRFEVVDGEVRLVDGVSLNHEEAASIELTVTATDSGGLSTEETFTIDVTDVNEGPSDLALDNTSVAENAPGAVVGTLSSYDPDAGDTITYTVSDDRFEVVDGQLQLADGVSLNHEEIDSIDLTVTATDSQGESTAEAFTISVEDVNEAPVDLTLTRETGMAESDFSAGDGHSGDSVERLGLETDAIVFTMSFTTADDVTSTQTLFETGGSVYGTNVVIEDGMLLIYAGEGNDLELSVPIEGGTEYSFALELDTESNTIRVLLSDELPLDQMNADNSLVASLNDWTDRDYTGGNRMGVGEVGGGSSQGNIGGDFLGEIDGSGLQVFSDSHLDDVFTTVGLEENTENAVVGTLSVADPDAGDTVTYTVSDDRFEVVDGELRLVDGVTLDHEESSTIDITVTATDSGGLSTQETFTVDVIDLNEAPTDLDLDNDTIDENTTEGVVGTISVTDPDAGDTHTFRLVDGDDGPFAIDPDTGEISLVAPGMPDNSVLHIDASDADSVTEDGGVRAIQDLSAEGNTIQQNDADERPELTDDGPFGEPGLAFDGVNDRMDISDDSTLNLSSQSERSFAMTIRTGEDVESRQVIYEEGGTINGFNFYIDDGQLYMGAWSDSNGWSFEAVSVDVEPGESYSIVTVFDGESGTYTAFVNGENVGSVEVGDSMSAHSGNIGLGGIAQHTVFHDGASSANDGYYFEGSVGEFAVFNDALSEADVTGIDMDFRGITPDIDFESRDSYDLTVEVTDAAGATYEEVITINVNDLNEGPGDVALDGDTVSENDAGAVIGSVSATDADAGDAVTYTVSDDRFEVVDGQLQLVDGVSLDHETAETLEITITATDESGLSSEQTFTINVADVNEGPSNLSLDGSSVAENDAGAVVGTLSSFDPDAGDSVTYTVSDDRFEVVDGELRLVDGVSLDHEETASLELTVTATDGDGLSTQETFTIDVTDVNEGPTDLSLDGNTVAENDAGAPVGTLSSFDPDAGDSVTYTVSDDRFEVVDGEVRLVDGVSLDHEEAASLELTVTATDSEGLSTEETFTIEVTDVNEGPADLSLDGNTVAENDAGAVVGTLSSFDPDAGDSVTYTVSDDRFEVVDGEVRLVDGVSLDHEEAASLELTITATDSEGLSTEETFTIDVTDVNEGPSDLSLDGDSVAENEAGATVGTLSSFDPDVGDSVTYTVSDDRFEVVDGEVRLVDGVSLDHEEAASIELTVTATDSEGLSTEETFTIDVTDVNEGPSDLSLDGNSVAENDAGAVVGTLSSFDPDAGDAITYTVSDARFEVVDGEVRLVDGVSLDHEDAASIELTVTATDSGGLSTEESFTIDVTDVNEGPGDLALDGNSVAENDAGAVVGTLSSFDPDAGDTVTYTVSDDRFEVVDGEIRLVDGVSLDHEDAASIDLTVTATDGAGLSTEETFTIDVTDVNEGPSDLSLDGNTVAENDAGAVVGTLSSFDPDAGDTITYTVSDDRFEVVDGQLQLADGVSLNHEEAASIEVTVTATDADGLSTEETFTVDVADVNEAPGNIQLTPQSGALSLNQDGGLDDNAISANMTDFPTDAITVEVSFTSDTPSEGSGTPLFSYAAGGGGGNDVLLWAENSSGKLSVFLDGQRFQTDINNSDLFDGEEHTVAFTWDQDTGELIVYVDGEEEYSRNVNVSELNSDGTVTLGQEQDSIGGNYDEGQVFQGEFGEVRIYDEALSDTQIASNAAGDVEQDGLVTHWDMGQATDGVITDLAGNNDLQLENGAEIINHSEPGVLSVTENTPGAVIGTLSSTDPDVGDSVTYSVSDGRFEIVDGELRLADGVSLDHEDAGTVDVTITATDSAGLSSEETFTINVDNVEEAPSDLTLDNTSVAENDAGATVGTLSSYDPDGGEAITYTVSDDRFEVVDGELRLADGVSLDHEDAASIEVTVTATDESGLSTEETFSIDVTDVNEAPSGIELNTESGAFLEQGGLLVIEAENYDSESAGSGGHAWGDSDSDGMVHVDDGGNAYDMWRSESSVENDSPELTYSIQIDTPGTYYVHIRGDAEDGPSGNADSVHIGIDGERITGDGGLTGFGRGDDWGSTDTYTGQVVAITFDEPGTYDLNLWAREDGVSVDQIVLTQDSDFDPASETLTESPRVGGDGILENEAGATVGTLSAFDPDAGDSVTFTVSDDRFEVVDGELKLVDGVSLDFEDASSIEVVVTATDSEGLTNEESFTLDVADVNEAPTGLSVTSEGSNLITGGSFEEQDVRSGGWRGFGEDASGNWDSANGIEVWNNLGGIDAADGNQFLELDYTNAADAISQTVSTEAGQTYIVSFDMRARGASTTDTIEVYWNGELVGIYDPASTDWEEVSFEVTGTGAGDVLEFREADGESDSLGAHLDNISMIEVPLTLVENDAGAEVGTVSVFDADAGDSIIYSVSDDRFEVVDGALRLKDGVSLDYEAEQSVDVTVTATDEGGLETSETVTIDVLDVAEDVQLADGGDTYTETGKAEASVTGGDGDDTMIGGTGGDNFAGGDGNDIFVYGADGGSDSFDGGAGWTDSIDLSGALGEDAVYGEDWTITVTEGEIVSEDANSIELSDDASGFITLDNGETIDFSNVEQIGF